MIQVNITVDIKDTIRTAVDPSTLRKLGEPQAFFIQGDVEFVITVLDDGTEFDLTTIGAGNLLWSIKKASDPDGEQLVLSDSAVISGAGSNIVTFTADTATVEMEDYLEGTIDQPVLCELVDNTVSASPQMMARTRLSAINRGFDGPASLPVYANIQHKITVDPDRVPDQDDDASDGFSLGSIWLYFNLGDPANPGIFINEISTVGAAVWIDLIRDDVVTSVFGRIGVVVAVVGDYAASEVTNDSGVAGVNVDDALDTLAAAIPPVAPVDSVFGRVGVVVAVAGDYVASQVTNDSTVSGVNVDDALESLDTDISNHIGDSANPHATSVANIGSGTLAQLNGAVSDATLDDITGSRTPSGSAGGSLTGTYPDPGVDFSGAPVQSVFGRTGTVIAVVGDYAASEVTNDSGVVGVNVDDALDTLAATIPPVAPVDSVFGRTGVVIAATSDYDADQVDYDNTTSGLTATDVQAAIDELDTLIPAIHVDSVFGRTGVVIAVVGDYSASEVTNDSTVTGVNVDDALNTLDTDLTNHTGDTANPHFTDLENIGSGTLAELNDAITDATLDDNGDSRPPTGAAGGDLGGTYPDPTIVFPVDSVFGRTGTVIAAVSDYDADQVDYDNATSGLTAVEVQAAIDELAVVITQTATLTTVGSGVNTIATIILDDDTVYNIEIVSAVGRRTDAADNFVGTRRGAFFREAAGSATQEGMTDTDFTRRSDNQFDATLSTSGNNVLIEVEGNTGKTLNWVIFYTVTKVT